MRPFNSPANHTPSVLWLWGFWIYVGAAFAAFVLSVYAPTPTDRVLRCVAGALLFVAGVHQLRVGKYKRATRGPYTIWGLDSYLISMDGKGRWIHNVFIVLRRAVEIR